MVNLSIVEDNIRSNVVSGLLDQNEADTLLKKVEEIGAWEMTDFAQKEALKAVFKETNFNEHLVDVDSDIIMFAVKSDKIIIDMLRIFVQTIGQEDIKELLENWGRWNSRRLQDLAEKFWLAFVNAFSRDGYFISDVYSVWLAIPDSTGHNEPWGDVDIKCLPRLLALPGQLAGIRRFVFRCTKGERGGKERRPNVRDGDIAYFRAGKDQASDRTHPRQDFACSKCKEPASCHNKCKNGFREIVREGGVHSSMLRPSPLYVASLSNILTLCVVK